eukprot:gene720-43459_t
MVAAGGGVGCGLGGGGPQRCPAPGQCADLSLAAAHTKGGGYYGD